MKHLISETDRVADVGHPAADAVAAALARAVRAGATLEVVRHMAGRDSSWRVRVAGREDGPELDATSQEMIPAWLLHPAQAIVMAGAYDLRDAVAEVGSTKPAPLRTTAGAVDLHLPGEGFRVPIAVACDLHADGSVTVRAGRRRPECEPIAEAIRAVLSRT